MRFAHTGALHKVRCVGLQLIGQTHEFVWDWLQVARSALRALAPYGMREGDGIATDVWCCSVLQLRFVVAAPLAPHKVREVTGLPLSYGRLAEDVVTS